MFQIIQRYLVVAIALLACLASVVTSRAQSSGKWWTGYGNGPDNSRYFASKRIDKSNINQLQVAWTYPHGETGSSPIVVRGVVYGRGRHGSLVAVDAKTGKELWNQRFADWKEGYYATSAPIVANGVLISGMAGGESTTRGFLDGWDPETGKKLWRRYTIPAPG